MGNRQIVLPLSASRQSAYSFRSSESMVKTRFPTTEMGEKPAPIGMRHTIRGPSEPQECASPASADFPSRFGPRYWNHPDFESSEPAIGGSNIDADRAPAIANVRNVMMFIPRVFSRGKIDRYARFGDNCVLRPELASPGLRFIATGFIRPIARPTSIAMLSFWVEVCSQIGKVTGTEAKTTTR